MKKKFFFKIFMEIPVNLTGDRQKHKQGFRLINAFKYDWVRIVMNVRKG